MSYHVARASANPRDIWGHRFTNLRDAMVTAEEMTKMRGEAHTVWEMKVLWTAEPKEDPDGTSVA